MDPLGTRCQGSGAKDRDKRPGLWRDGVRVALLVDVSSAIIPCQCANRAATLVRPLSRNTDARCGKMQDLCCSVSEGPSCMWTCSYRCK